MPCFSATGWCSIEITAASATLPRSAFKRSASLPRLANFTSGGAMSFCASHALPIMSGVASGADVAKVAPLMSAAAFNSLRANTLCTAAGQGQPTIFTSAPCGAGDDRGRRVAVVAFEARPRAARAA